MNKTSKTRKTMRGTVIRRSGDKTVAVEVARVFVHPLYQRRQTRTKIYLAHDARNEVQVGQDVVIQESRPISAQKRWIVLQAGDTSNQ